MAPEDFGAHSQHGQHLQHTHTHTHSMANTSSTGSRSGRVASLRGPVGPMRRHSSGKAARSLPMTSSSTDATSCRPCARVCARSGCRRRPQPCVCTCVHAFPRPCACAYCVRVRGGLNHAGAHAHTHARTETQTHKCARAHARTHARTHTHIHTHKRRQREPFLPPESELRAGVFVRNNVHKFDGRVVAVVAAACAELNSGRRSAAGAATCSRSEVRSARCLT